MATRKRTTKKAKRRVFLPHLANALMNSVCFVRPIPHEQRHVGMYMDDGAYVMVGPKSRRIIEKVHRRGIHKSETVAAYDEAGVIREADFAAVEARALAHMADGRVRGTFPVDGRVRGTFPVEGSITGRLSS